MKAVSKLQCHQFSQRLVIRMLTAQKAKANLEVAQVDSVQIQGLEQYNHTRESREILHVYEEL